MISTRVAAAIAAGILVVGILVGSAGAVLLGSSRGAAEAGWGPGYHGMMGGDGSGMMGGAWRTSDMLDWMREHMGDGTNSR